LTGETLPGLSVAQNVSHFHTAISDIKSRDEAARKKKEEEQAAASGASAQVGEAALPAKNSN